MYKKFVNGLLTAAFVCSVIFQAVPIYANTEEPSSVVGTTYYVDSQSGDDSNSGTNINAPWKSLNKVTETTFSPGDRILLKSGSVWNGE